jgi:Family of unknown function (DUF6687)
MRYVPFGPELVGVPNVVVDGLANAATVLALSHWPRSATPEELKADTSSEIVVNFLRSPHAEALRGDAEAVSNNHFDIDGLMGIWAILNPEDALEHAELVVAIAECGDFERWTGEHAAKAVCALLGLESMDSSPLHDGLAAITDPAERTAYLYSETLPLVPAVLRDIDSLEEFWHEEYERIAAGRRLFETGSIGMKETPALDLAVFALPEDVHPIAVNERTQCSRVVLMIDEFRYLVRYRYETWVEYQSRAMPPRIDLEPFADFLQTFEGNPGYWKADDVASIVPLLRLQDEDEDMAASSITPGLFVNLLAQFLNDNAENESMLWSPATADMGA